MKIPVATYRIQLSPSFKLAQLREIIPYLDQLGVTTIYAAPFFQARKGSTHGYDVVDPLKINSEIGTLEEFREIAKMLQERGITWLQDIVPNHMAFDPSNPWLKDILELGAASAFYDFFDIDWSKGGKVLAPFLGAPLHEVISNGEYQLQYQDGTFTLEYYEHRFPASAETYAFLFEEMGDTTWAEETVAARQQAQTWQHFKSSLAQKLGKNQEFKEQLDRLLEKLNGSAKEMEKILDLQHYEPVHWKTTEQRINYRRFFTINHLICLRMERDQVFKTYHEFIYSLYKEGLVSGLRIDHIDGLFDPTAYLDMLRNYFGGQAYVLVEKILESGEQLPGDWKAQGTSGYDFLAQVNQLLTDPTGKDFFSAAYQEIHPGQKEYLDLVYEKKLFMLHQRMGGELRNLTENFIRDFLPVTTDPESYREALGLFLAGFPLYRIYPRSFPLDPEEQQILEQAFQAGVRLKKERRKELEYILLVLTGKAGKDPEKMLYFLKRCQQFTGPLAAKGVEDTVFYRYNRLISHNEVGDSPHIFGNSPQAFHNQMVQKQALLPLSINATATHDTKRGEDARMRINVLSEIPEQWFDKVTQWRTLNGRFIQDNAPDPNEEYFIYQTLIGAMPFNDELPRDFLERTTQYLQKVLREAKEHSSWSRPDTAYEQRVEKFLAQILDHQEFRNSLEDFRKRINVLGAWKSLSQTLIKITAPGIPDIYQGTELWDLSFVDPDNRRPVDYEKRNQMLESLRELSGKKQLRHLLEELCEGRLKFYVLHKTLRLRLEDPSLFITGEYTPVTITGEHRDKLIGFIREKNKKACLILAPLHLARLMEAKGDSLDHIDWGDTALELPSYRKGEWENILTGTIHTITEKTAVQTLLKDFPLGLFRNHR